MKSIETLILSNLLHNEEYCRKVVPFIKKDYFSDSNERIIAEELLKFFNQYNKIPTPEILAIQISNRDRIQTQQLQVIENVINELNFENINQEWLLKESEKFCKERAVTNAIIDAFEIVSGKDKTRLPDAIPSLLNEALGVCFDTSVGHDYFEDASMRYDFYKRVDEKIPFDIDILNKITNGGLAKKTMTLFLSPSGIGKTMVMCHLAASTLLQGKNVLYISLEMSEERIAERIDANLFDIEMDELAQIDKNIFNNKINKVINKTKGKLVIKEYPPVSAHAGHFKLLLEELKIKKDFIADYILIDYLNICASSRLKIGGSTNTYTYIKSIGEEIRGLAVEYNVPLISAVQTNRNGYNNTDIESTDTSDSMGTTFITDLLLALISTEELEGLNQLMIKQLKNRYNDVNYYKRFIVGIDRSRMKLYNVEDNAQKNITDSGQPIENKNTFGSKTKTLNTDFTF